MDAASEPLDRQQVRLGLAVGGGMAESREPAIVSALSWGGGAAVGVDDRLMSPCGHSDDEGTPE
ncbi:hypothetical protein GCM10022243_31310 [Saccharothrix violaceirubra]